MCSKHRCASPASCSCPLARPPPHTTTPSPPLPDATLSPTTRSLLLVATACVAAAAPRELSPSHFSGKRILVVSAHPDDNEFFFGGTLAAINALPEPAEAVGYAIFTNGDKGCFNASLCSDATTTEQIAAMRAEETVAAAAALGVKAENVFLLHYNDGELGWAQNRDLETSLIAVVRQFKPHVAVTWERYPVLELAPGDWGDAGFHPDHQVSARVTLAVCAGPGAGNKFMAPGVGGAPWQTTELYFARFGVAAATADVFVPIPEECVQAKLRATSYHYSQALGNVTGAPAVQLRQGMKATAGNATAAAQTKSMYAYVEAFATYGAAWE